MIGADNVLAKGDGRTIKHGQLPLRQENVGNVRATSEQGGMGKCQKCRSRVGARWERKWYMTTKKISGGFYTDNELCYIVLYSAWLCFHSAGQSKAISGQKFIE